MNLDEAIKRLENAVVCERCHISGKECKEDCPTQYEAGTVGECIEAMETILDYVKKIKISEASQKLNKEGMSYHILLRSAPGEDQELVAECYDEAIARLLSGAFCRPEASFEIKKPIYSVQFIKTKAKE